MPVGILRSLPGQVIHVFVCRFNSYARGGDIACLVLFSPFYIVRVGSGHLCFPSWLPVDQPYFALSPSMPSFPLLLNWQAGQCHSSDWFVIRHHGCDNNQVS